MGTKLGHILYMGNEKQSVVGLKLFYCINSLPVLMLAHSSHRTLVVTTKNRAIIYTLSYTCKYASRCDVVTKESPM